MRATEERRARSFAPGHVTGIFTPDLASHDPRGRGSRGVGLVLTSGARADVTWRPNAPTHVRVRGPAGERLPISEEAVRHLVPRGAGSVVVEVQAELPVGQGFGMSAAGTLASSLAVAHLLSVPRTRAVEVAHLAELLGGGGLGGVPAILGGGLEVRTTAGIPPWGKVSHVPFPYSIVVGVVGGPLPSPTLLRQDRFLARVARAARELDELETPPAPEAFLEASERFTDRLALAPPPLVAVIRALRRRGWWAAQAMFGRSFFAVPSSPRARSSGFEFLEENGLRALELGPSRSGARVLRGATQPF